MHITAKFFKEKKQENQEKLKKKKDLPYFLEENDFVNSPKWKNMDITGTESVKKSRENDTLL